MQSASQPNRLDGEGVIDRSRPLCFTYNGRPMTGYAGDTVASALIAGGVRIIGRSLKYRRPRGFYGIGVEDPNSMLAVQDAYGYEPAMRSGQIPLCEGLDVRSVTGWPSPQYDIGAIVRAASPILGAGFYYKTMWWPNWMLFEPFVRRATGFGRLRWQIERRKVQHRHAAVDVLVVGAGASGLEAALGLSHRDLKVVVADMDIHPGGSLNWEDVIVDGETGRAWSDGAIASLESDPHLTLLAATTVSGAYENNVFVLVQTLRDEKGVCAERHWRIHARHVVLSTGIAERPLLFPNNDRPGVMLAMALRRLIADYRVTPGRRLVVYSNNDSGYLTALSAARAGIGVAAVLDTRPQQAAGHARAVKELGIRCVFSAEIVDVIGSSGLSAVKVAAADGVERIGCDCVAVSGGWTPLIHLACHRGSKPVFDEARSMFVVPGVPERWRVIGGAAGVTNLAFAFEQGRQAATEILAAERRTPVEAPARRVVALDYGTASPVWRPRRGSSSSIWVDFQNDVKVSDIEIAALENYVSVEHLKRYTTLGMGTDQGRTSNVNGLAVMAGLTGRSVGEIGATTFRPMFSAVRMATIAGGREGDLFQPRRYLPADASHRRLEAEFEDFGWERPDWYRSNGGDREAAVRAEMAAVRNEVGVFDASSLGKIEVVGPDAGTFLARFYISDMATLKPGSVRYSVMLKEDGVIFDDGVVACLGTNRFLVGTTSGNAEAVAAWFERWRQTEWPKAKVSVSNITANWACVAIAGPKARALLDRLNLDMEVGRHAFAHMQVREGHWDGAPMRIARVSFSGELQYEVSVQARYASSLLALLLERGRDLAPKPVGVEAWLRLRLEKGYIHVGTDTNGRTSPLDIGMGPVVARRKDDFIGKRSLRLAYALSPEREQLVGVAALDGKLEVGARVLQRGKAAPPCPTEGYVTSACNSPSVGQSIGLALIQSGFVRRGEEIALFASGRTTRARIVSPVFYDPENQRLKL